MARLLLIVSSCASAAGLSIGTSGINRRVACQQAAVAAAGMATTLLPSAAFAKEENTKEKDLLRETGKQMKALLDGKAAFIAALDAGEEVKVPAAIPFTTFQKLVRTQPLRGRSPPSERNSWRQHAIAAGPQLSLTRRASTLRPCDLRRRSLRTLSSWRQQSTTPRRTVASRTSSSWRS